jgi:hypothetical protein
MIRGVSVGPTAAEIKFLQQDDWKDKSLSQINGEIKRMGKENIRDKLQAMNMETRGVKAVMVKRLQNYYKKIFLNQRCPKRQLRAHISCDYFVGIDFEATCKENNGDSYPVNIQDILNFTCPGSKIICLLFLKQKKLRISGS